MRLRSILLVGAVLAAGAAVATSPSAADSALLRFKFPVGETIRYRQATDLGQMMQGMDLGMKMDQVTAFVFTADPKGVKAQQTMESAKVTVPPGSPMESGLGQLEETVKGVKITAVYSPRGEVNDLKIEGDPGQGPSMSSFLRMGFLGISFPEAAVSVGTTWKTDLDLTKELSMGGAGATKQTLPIKYEVKAMDSSTVTIASTFSGDFKLSGADGQSIDLKLSGTSTTVLDRETGIPKKIETTGLNTIGTPFGAMEQKLRQTIERL